MFIGSGPDPPGHPGMTSFRELRADGCPAAEIATIALHDMSRSGAGDSLRGDPRPPAVRRCYFEEESSSINILILIPSGLKKTGP